MKAAGIKDVRTILSMRNKYLKTGSFADKPRSGRRRILSDGKLKAVMELLVEEGNNYFSGSTLLARAAELGLVHPEADKCHFVKRLRAYVERLGHKLRYGRQSTVFLITARSSQLRRQFCDFFEPYVQPDTLPSVCAADEIILEESPHPTGKLVTHN